MPAVAIFYRCPTGKLRMHERLILEKKEMVCSLSRVFESDHRVEATRFCCRVSSLSGFSQVLVAEVILRSFFGKAIISYSVTETCRGV